MKTKMKYWLVLFLSGCIHTGMNREFVPGQPKTISVYVDQNFTFFENKAIDRAIQEWNHTLNGQLNLQIQEPNIKINSKVINDQSKFFVVKSVVVEPGSINKTAYYPAPLEAGNAYGYADKNVAYIFRDRFVASYMYGVVLHELGHLLGADHKGDGLMATEFDRDKMKCVDFDTIEQVTKVWHLPMQKMHHC